MNGDGYDDLIVGAYANDAAGTDYGSAYIFFGGPLMDYLPDVILSGTEVGNFGIAVSCAGDVNGDGFDDVIVGEPSAATSRGKAYIYFGGYFMNKTPDVSLTGTATYTYFGSSVSSAGDVNGDGYCDVIVGAYESSIATGRAYIFFGGNSMNSTADVTLTGEANSDQFGRSVSGAGDFNGDGFGDVIVGAPLNDFTFLNNGSAYIFFGGTVMNSVFDIKLSGTVSSDNFGYCVSNAGDVNGDGFSDVIIGAYTNDLGGSNAGCASIFYGSAGGG